jgi:hypothetical protein
MVRRILALLVGAVLLVASTTRADDPPPAGNWKINLLGGDRTQTLWLIRFVNTDGKWSGSVLASGDQVPKVTLDGLTFSNDRLRFTLQGQKQIFTLDAAAPKGAAKSIKGSLTIGSEMAPCELEATTLTTLKPVDIAKDILANQPDSPKVFGAVLGLVGSAADLKAKPEEVRGWAEKLWKAAEPYGVRWQQQMAVETADLLSQQDGYAAIGLAYAQRAERLLEPKDPARIKHRVLAALAAALEKNGKAEDAKEVQGRIAKLDKEIKGEQLKLEAQADEEYLKKMPPFKVDPFAGRKGKSSRAVLAELFTGTQCPPCVAADLAFDGVIKAYKPADVVLLQYHVHVPGPDPLTNLDTEARLEYYFPDQDDRATPTLLLNGKVGFGQGSSNIEDSEKIYGEFRKRIDPLLEQEAKAVVEVTATRRGNKIEINAEAADVATTGDNIRLRFVLVEETQRYVGGNGIRFHHHVVRAMPGGDNGFPVREKKVRQAVSLDLVELKKQISQYLRAYSKREKVVFPDPEEVLDLKNLRVVAFVQNDKTKEVLQAKEVEVSGGKE